MIYHKFLRYVPYYLVFFFIEASLTSEKQLYDCYEPFGGYTLCQRSDKVSMVGKELTKAHAAKFDISCNTNEFLVLNKAKDFMKCMPLPICEDGKERGNQIYSLPKKSF